MRREKKPKLSFRLLLNFTELTSRNYLAEITDASHHGRHSLHDRRDIPNRSDDPNHGVPNPHGMPRASPDRTNRDRRQCKVTARERTLPAEHRPAPHRLGRKRAPNR